MSKWSMINLVCIAQVQKIFTSPKNPQSSHPNSTKSSHPLHPPLGRPPHIPHPPHPHAVLLRPYHPHPHEYLTPDTEPKHPPSAPPFAFHSSASSFLPQLQTQTQNLPKNPRGHYPSLHPNSVSVSRRGARIDAE